MKKIVLVVLLGLTLPFGPSSAVAQENKERALHRRLLRSTGLLIIPSKERSEYILATCCVIDAERRLVVAGYDVLRGATKVGVQFPEYRRGRIIGQIDYYAKRSPIIGRVVMKSFQVDLAIIQLSRLPSGVQALPLAQRPPRVGETIYALGNHMRKPGVIWWFRQSKVQYVGVVTNRNGNQVLRSAHLIRSTPNSKPSDSGGPVVDASGRLVSVHSGNVKDRFSDSIQVRELSVLLGELRDQSKLVKE
jgi:S1-C subfamily serine protease